MCPPGSDDLRRTLLPTHLPVRPSGLFSQRLASRRRSRQCRRRLAWLIAECLLAHLCFHELGGCCDERKLKKALGPFEVSLEQQLQFHFLCEDIRQSCCLTPVVGRGAALLHEHVELHSDFLGGSRDVNAEISKLANTVARPVIPERAKVPAVAAQVRPEDHLPPAKARVFCQQELLVLPSEPPGRPRRCHMISQDAEYQLRTRLLAAGAAMLWPVEDIPISGGEALLAGWFAVPHSEDADRLILDRRPQNHGERRLTWLRLPLGCQFGRIILGPKKSVRGSGYDLTTFFSQLREHPSGLSRQCVGREFDGGEYASHSGVAGQRYVLAMTCLGMGDLNSTDIAQETHIAILSAGAALAPGGLMQWGDPLSAGDLLQGIYIDDGVIVAIVDTDKAHLPGADNQLVSASLKALKGANLDVAEKKSFGAAVAWSPDAGDAQPVGDTTFVAWGTQVCSETGHVGTLPEKRVGISSILWKLVAKKCIERQILERALSLVPHPASHRRECLAFIHRAYKWAGTLTVGKLVPWAADVRGELLTVSLVLFVCHGNIRWPVSTRISATDATPTAGGSTACVISQPLARALWAATEEKGSATYLRSSLLDADDEAADRDVEQVFTSAPWRVTRSRKFDEAAHVNLQELLEISEEVREISMLSTAPSRHVNGTDSQVSLCAAAKGRSPSHLLNGRLKQLAARKIFGRKDLGNVKVDTKKNPADHPSRFVDLPPPETAPPWLSFHLKSAEQEFVCPEAIPPDLFCFREAYAGCAELTRAVRDAGIPCARPLEAFPSRDNTEANAHSRFSAGRYISVNDLDDESVMYALEVDIKRGLVRWLHFGIPCTSWSSMNTINGGTRSTAFPDGGVAPLDRECRGNRQAAAVCRLAMLIHSHGGLFTVENPVPSHLWKSKHFVQLREFLGDSHFEATFDQCSYDLKLPGCTWCEYCKKRTRIIGNFIEVESLVRSCPGLSASHQHMHAIGSRVVDGVRHSLAGAAGRYPRPLCDAVALAGRTAFLRLFWKGLAPWSQSRRC